MMIMRINVTGAVGMTLTIVNMVMTIMCINVKSDGMTLTIVNMVMRDTCKRSGPLHKSDSINVTGAVGTPIQTELKRKKMQNASESTNRGYLIAGVTHIIVNMVITSMLRIERHV
jgi:hypothetical protein